MKTVIISLGGSIIYPDKLDQRFLISLKKLLLKEKCSFVLYCGGGHLARRWQSIGRSIGLGKYLLDWVGIFATRQNAKSVKKIFGDEAHPIIVIDPNHHLHFSRKILIAAGWKPGWSTDFDSVLLAKNMGVTSIINMSNVEYVYDKDPRKNPSAKPIEAISWKKFQKLVGTEWKPGLNMPFDPIASKKAAQLKLTVHLIGKNLPNLRNLLHNKRFKGTTISA
ncbi:MAG TPA: UMP kinase [Candidatus Nanoarchaeia archaeon]|nr:UMP kinase [Candidatus Nanoarchaeia archaeon]